jgi:hypothetical protein
MDFLRMYKYLPVVALIIGIGMVFLAGDTYRYECQDPAHWSTPECEPPICNASGTCTTDLVTINGEKVTSEQLAAMVAEIEAAQKAVGINLETTDKGAH